MQTLKIDMKFICSGMDLIKSVMIACTLEGHSWCKIGENILCGGGTHL